MRYVAAIVLTGIIFLELVPNLVAQSAEGGSASGAPPGGVRQFSQQTLEIKGAIDDVIVKDLDNDGLKEILFQQGRNLLEYKLRKQSDRYIPVASYSLPPDACIYDIQILPMPFVKPEPGTANKPNIIYLSAQGLYFMPLDTSTLNNNQPITPSLFFHTPNIFTREVFDKPLHKDLFYNLDNDHKAVVIPKDNKLTLIHLDKNFTEEINLPLAAYIYPNDNSILEPLVTETSLPAFSFIDLNNDKHNDLVFLNNRISGCLWNGEKFGPPTSLLTLPADIYDPSAGLDFGYTLTPLVRDSNGDGRADILCVNDGEGIVYIYLNRSQSPGTKERPAAMFDNTPSQIIRTNKWIIEYDLMDLNGDGMEDLVLVQMNKLGVMSGLQAIMSQTLELEIAVYLAHAGPDTAAPVYAKSPDYTRSIKLPFSFSYASPLSLVGERALPKIRSPYIWNLHGDFNGDKINDLLVSGNTESTLEIYAGNRDRVFEKSPQITLNLPARAKNYKLIGMPYGAPIISDLNNDGKSDIIIPLLRENADKSIDNSYEIFISL